MHYYLQRIFLFFIPSLALVSVSVSICMNSLWTCSVTEEINRIRDHLFQTFTRIFIEYHSWEKHEPFGKERSSNYWHCYWLQSLIDFSCKIYNKCLWEWNNFMNLFCLIFNIFSTAGGSMLGDVNISAILDSFSVSYDKRVRPNYGGKSQKFQLFLLLWQRC